MNISRGAKSRAGTSTFLRNSLCLLGSCHKKMYSSAAVQTMDFAGGERLCSNSSRGRRVLGRQYLSADEQSMISRRLWKKCPSTSGPIPTMGFSGGEVGASAPPRKSVFWIYKTRYIRGVLMTESSYDFVFRSSPNVFWPGEWSVPAIPDP